MTEVLITLPFKRRFKDLVKRYRKIQADGLMEYRSIATITISESEGYANE